MCQSQNKEVGIKCLYICSEVIRRKELDLVEMYTTTLDDKRFYSQILPKLSIHQSMTHLKRVHRGRILLGPVKEFEESDTRELLEGVGCGYVLQTSKIPASVPATRVQYDFCQRYWPVHFRADTELERKLSGTYFSANELQVLRQLMDNAHESDGCIITRSNYQILGQASNSRLPSDGPLKHPFMRAFDHLTQGHIAPKRSADGEQHHGTDCIVFIHEEPCPMCCMAMVHARVKTVFFRRTSTKGAFVTNCQLHLKPQLNHHYEVFQLLY